MREIVRRWLPPLAWMGLIFFLSAQPSLPSAPGRWDVLLKKTTHAVAYAILTWLYMRALRGRWDDTVVRVVGIVLAVAYAISDEYHQTFVPGRSGSWVDVAIDGVGILVATAVDWQYGVRSRSRASGACE